MTEHYTRNTVQISAWCAKCRRETMHRVDSGRKGPCLECLLPVPQPTGSFFCARCGRNTLHRMIADGWKKGPCLECGAEQLNLFT